MKTVINFDQNETKKLLSSYDFEFFLEQNYHTHAYNQSDVDMVKQEYLSKLENLKEQQRKNKKQFSLFLEGQVRKMFTGGFLPALFHLDESRVHTLMNFSEVGENWAYFSQWQYYYKKKLTKEKAWNIVTRVGSVLAILLSVLKILEVFMG